MAIKLFNTLTKKVEVFQPLKQGKVGMYTCGPTVYWFPHIGNMRAYLCSDLLRRTFEYNNFEVELVINITDVGHLTSDSDEGEDKMIVAMKREGKTAYEIADFYTKAFLRDLNRLNIKPAHHYPKATEHIAEQIKMIKDIERNGFTYQTTDGIYFDTSKLPQYGILSGQKSEEKQAGARVEMKEKRNATDFALWKFSPAGVQREMEWESPWGKGFPGWHIECSAMSIKYLGMPFDVHTGGIDHIPVHHENELAQAIGCCGAYHARFWIHNDFLTVDGGKMSKSLGNLFTIDDLVSKGFDPLEFRYFLLGAHYRAKLNFTWSALEAAQNALRRLRKIVRDWDSPEIGCAEYEQRFLNAINNDLNSPQALAILWEMVEDAKMPTSARAQSLLKFDFVLGLGLGDFVGKRLEIPEEVLELIQQRDEARVKKDWGESDRLREEIKNRGFIIEDTNQSQTIHEI
ncbi:cysteine--tRNA ligase [Candidatus Uhrbacteria bacterium]|nr:cysteine--tRNA ligase [Candidatus Uhrbacteria bacterium]